MLPTAICFCTKELSSASLIATKNHKQQLLKSLTLLLESKTKDPKILKL